jgi:predicted DCC family thiol-disulfide oxidoreductase YuxK
MTVASPSRPVVVYDGDCGICRRWVDYWSALTGDAVAYRPYQEAAADYPDIPREDFRRAVRYIDVEGDVYGGAAATFRVLQHVPGRRAWWWLYTHVPGFASVSEWAYGFLSRRRGLLAALTTLLWGRRLVPEAYALTTWLFLRGLGLVWLAAFASLSTQVLGLIGSDGILPAATYLRAAHGDMGAAAYRVVPTLFWLDANDAVLYGGCFVGTALALLVVVDRFTRMALPLLFVLYLSYVQAGQDFMMFQWDMLLLETGFLAMFLPFGSRVTIWLFRWLAFRYLLMAGAAKLLSGDAAWRGLTALQYHFETQPLPTPLAWYAAHLPHWLLTIGTASALVIEVVLVVLVFAPRRLRMLAAWCVLGFEALILVTGNYNFFNLLTMLLMLFLFDDAALARLVPASLSAWVERRARQAAASSAARVDTNSPRVAAPDAHPSRGATIAAVLYAVIAIPVGADRVWQQYTQGGAIPVVRDVADAIAPFLVVNPYGLFAIMTTSRPEIVIEGSNDGRTWREYGFRYKPGALGRRPPWNIPHQPRLDWQMWFAALGGSWEDRWFANFLVRLLEGSPAVLDLLDANPFPGAPPKYVRAVVYDYRFADAATRAATGNWWLRVKLRDFSPVVSLKQSVTGAD